jgi:hypothetical protein
MCCAVPCCVLQEQQLYPCVGMRTKHEEIRANFGGAPFCVDLNKLHVGGWVFAAWLGYAVAATCAHQHAFLTTSVMLPISSPLSCTGASQHMP